MFTFLVFIPPYYFRLLCEGGQLISIFNVLLLTRCVPHLQWEQAIVNGAEENEGRTRRVGGVITRPFLMGMKGTWGPREGGSFQLLSEHQGWCHGLNKLVTSVLQLSSTSPSLSVCRCSAACWWGCAAFRPQPLFCLTSPVGRFGGGGGGLPGLGPYCGHGGLFHVLKSHFSLTLKGWAF